MSLCAYLWQVRQFVPFVACLRRGGPLWQTWHWKSGRCGGFDGIFGAASCDGVPLWQTAHPPGELDLRGRWQLTQ